jgi:hypothetical protein
MVGSRRRIVSYQPGALGPELAVADLPRQHPHHRDDLGIALATLYRQFHARRLACARTLDVRSRHRRPGRAETGHPAEEVSPDVTRRVQVTRIP